MEVSALEWLIVPSYQRSLSLGEVFRVSEITSEICLIIYSLNALTMIPVIDWENGDSESEKLVMNIAETILLSVGHFNF